MRELTAAPAILRGPCAVFAVALLAGGFAPVRAHAQNAPHERLARDIYKQLVEINTTEANGSTTEAAEAMAARFLSAKFPAADVKVLGPSARKGNLVVRYRGRGSAQKPLLLLAHLDVVEAKPEDWTVPPFTFTEKDGFYYGRGTSDDKAMAAIFVANLLRMKQQGIVPDRDIILALTADEEGGDENGVDWLLKNHRALVDAGYGLNEGGGGQARAGRKISNRVQASEKVYVDFTLEVTNKGGHSSQPQPENAIYQLADALARIGQHEFPVVLNEVTRAYFTRMADIESGDAGRDFRALVAKTDDAAVERLSAVPYYNALMRTTCVATMLNGGHATNALPQRATANVNCRILPTEDAAEVERTLERVIGNPKVSVTPVAPPKPSPPSPLVPEVLGPIERITQEMWPGVPVLPVMSTGATDGLYFRQVGIPIYGVSGLFGDMDDVRSHGRDERVGIREFYDGQEFLWRLVNELTGGRPRT